MLAETADDLLLLLRDELDDTVAPYLWSDRNLFAYLTEASDKLAEDTDGLYALVTVPVIAGTAVVPLPKHVLKIRSARLLSTGRAIFGSNTNAGTTIGDDYGRITASELFDSNAGTPRTYVGDYDPGAIRLVPIPDANDELELQCTVKLEFPVESGDDVPFQDTGDQRLLIHHMKASAYNKHDAETYDPQRSGMYARIYAAGAEERKTKLRNYRRPPGTVRMEYF